MKINNILTGLRIILTPFVLLCFYANSFSMHNIGIALFIMLCITDFLDGYLARMCKTESKLGKILDPLADKWLILASFILLIQKHAISSYAVSIFYIILFREIFVMAIRTICPVIASTGSSNISKIKTVLLDIGVAALLINLTYNYNEILHTAGITFLALGCIFAVWSGYKYFYTCYKLLKEND